MSLTTTTGRARPVLVAIAATLLAFTAACGGAAATTPNAQQAASGPSAGPVPSATVVEPPALTPGTPVPAPKGPPVLTLSGKISATNSSGTLKFDQATLDRLGRVQVNVYEPWVKQNLQFQGVWLADLMKTAQIDAKATSVHLTALDDYQIDLTMADINAGDIMLATRTGAGGPIAVDDGGPIRIIFTGDTAPKISPDQWIWSLTTIDVR